MPRIIDEMPTLRQVEDADAKQLVDWHLHLRPTMMNEELEIVKLVTRKYEGLPASQREHYARELRREHGF